MKVSWESASSVFTAVESGSGWRNAGRSEVPGRGRGYLPALRATLATNDHDGVGFIVAVGFGNKNNNVHTLLLVGGSATVTCQPISLPMNLLVVLFCWLAAIVAAQECAYSCPPRSTLVRRPDAVGPTSWYSIFDCLSAFSLPNPRTS